MGNNLNADSILQLILQGGVAPLLLIILWTGMKGYWVFKREMEDLRKDRDEWKEAALNGTRLARRSLEIATKSDEATT